jgi:hypothetical protein
MNKSYLFFFALILLSSCMDYATVKAINNPTEKVAMQDFYSPCCGSCGQRIVIDDLHNKQYALLVNCNIEDQYSYQCTPYGMGTQKQVITYKKNKIISHAFYKAVYDTIELKKMYPGTQREQYYDSSLSGKPVIPMTKIDSSLIEKYSSLTNKRNCNADYLKFIKGYILVAETSGRDRTEKKKVKFKANK